LDTTRYGIESQTVTFMQHLFVSVINGMRFVAGVGNGPRARKRIKNQEWCCRNTTQRQMSPD
jgi:hypothetical protein